MMTIILSLMGCAGLDQETNISELRVVAIQSEPPELSLSEFSMPISNGSSEILPETLDTSTEESIDEDAGPVAKILIADPLKEGYQYAVWQCTNFGDGCLEAEFFKEEKDLSSWISVGEATVQEIQVPIQLNPAWFALLENPELTQPIGATGLWVLACAPNQCDIVTKALAGEWDLTGFSNPFDLMVSLPIEKTSLGFRVLYVSQYADEATRLKNPVITPKTEESITTSSEKPTELLFDIELFQRDPDTASIYGYATVGGFDSNSLVNNILNELSVEKSLNWYVSEEDTKGEAELFVVVDDGLGGVSYWTDKASVQ